MVRLIATAIAGAVAMLIAGASAARGCASDADMRAGFVLNQVAGDDAGSLSEFVVAHVKQSRHTVSLPLDIAARQQAERFTAFLHDDNPAAFTRMLNAMLDGCRFGAAVRTSYGADVNALWARFAEGLRDEALAPSETH